MLGHALTGRLDELLDADDRDRATRYPGPRPGRQPVHTVYVPADRYGIDTVTEWGATARSTLQQFGPLPTFAGVEWAEIGPLVLAKLDAEPIEDLRIDFEDGYGTRDDDAEDAHVTAAARALAATAGAPGLPFATGVRIKSLEGPTRVRAVRTLDLFLDGLLDATPLPKGFRVTLPKVTSVAQVEAMVELCTALEAEYGLADGALRFEIQIETAQAIVGADGTATVARLLHGAAGRCAGLHYGTYDYSAAIGISAAYQSLDHPAADHAKQVMQVAAAGTGVPVSDGSTNVIPIGRPEEIRAAWERHAGLVRRSLQRGFYQGWDMHPGHLPTRYAATFSFYRSGFATAVDRLQRYLSRSAGGIMDEPATAQALAGYLSRGLDCGALTEAMLTDAPRSDAGRSLDRPTLDRLSRR